MRCPYLSSATKKVCVKMLEAQISGDLNAFDIRNFCDGNPIYCYYFRLPQLQKTLQNTTQRDDKIITQPLIQNTDEKPLPSLKELLFAPEENP